MNPTSEIENFYKGANIFVTGGTGFLGKLLLAKLLRTCCVNKIYLMIRPKRGKTKTERFTEIFNEPIYDALKQQQPNFLEKVAIIDGDCMLPNLGLSIADTKFIINEIDVVFHFAATVRFDESLRKATYINVRATEDLLKIAKEMSKLKSFVHISTAYSNCPKKTIEEKFYEPPIPTETLYHILDTFKDDLINSITPSLIGKWPNTYSFTKCLAEDAVRKAAGILPISVVRPSIIVSTYKEPLEGWTDNFYGPAGVMSSVSVGLTRVVYGHSDCKCDIIPADYVVNCVIAAGWKTQFKKEKDEVPIYNVVSSTENAVLWGSFFSNVYTVGMRLVPNDIIWFPKVECEGNKQLYDIKAYLFQEVTARIGDFVVRCAGKKPFLVSLRKKINSLLGSLHYFTTNDWIFINNNTQELWNEMNEMDKNNFEFSAKLIDWADYYPKFFQGFRVYLLKDPIATLPNAVKKVKRAKFVHYFLLYAIFILSLLFLLKIFALCY